MIVNTILHWFCQKSRNPSHPTRDFALQWKWSGSQWRGPPNTQKNLKNDLLQNLVHFRVIFRKILIIPIIPDLPPKIFWLFQPPHRAQSKIRVIFSKVAPKTLLWQLWRLCARRRARDSKNIFVSGFSHIVSLILNHVNPLRVPQFWHKSISVKSWSPRSRRGMGK